MYSEPYEHDDGVLTGPATEREVVAFYNGFLTWVLAAIAIGCLAGWKAGELVFAACKLLSGWLF